MDSQNLYWMFSEEYKDIDLNQVSKIFLKNGTILELSNNPNNFQPDTKNDNINVNYNNNYVYSDNQTSEISNEDNFNRKIIINRNEEVIYSKPVENEQKVLIPVKENNNNFVEKENESNVQNFAFESVPQKKYNYKPYKQPRRKHQLGKQ